MQGDGRGRSSVQAYFPGSLPRADVEEVCCAMIQSFPISLFVFEPSTCRMAFLVVRDSLSVFVECLLSL